MGKHMGDRQRTVIFSAGAALGAVLLFVLLFSGIQLVMDVSDTAVKIMSGIALCAGCFAGAFAAANVRRKHGIAVGIVFGIVTLAAVFALGMIFVRSFSSDGFFAKAVLIFCSAAAGGIIGVNTKPLFR
ncbi:MAG: TIGR04086 family membrane protein [Oscillospiraceae bacterium]